LPIAGSETFAPPLLMWGASKSGARIQESSVTRRYRLEISRCVRMNIVKTVQNSIELAKKTTKQNARKAPPNKQTGNRVKTYERSNHQDNPLGTVHQRMTGLTAEQNRRLGSRAKRDAIISIVGERRRPLDGNHVLAHGLSGVGAVRVIISTLVEGALLNTTLAILDLQVTGEEVARGIGALSGDDIALSLATGVIEDAVVELLHGEVGVGLFARAVGRGCLDGAVTITVTITERLLGEVGDGGAWDLLDVVGVGTCDHDLEVLAVLALVGRDGGSENVAPEGCLDHSSGARVGVTGTRVLQ